MSIFTGPFWKATIERAIKTLAQTAAATAGVGVGLLDIGWVDVASLSGAAALLSVLTSVASAAATDGSPSAGGGEHLESYTLSTGVVTADHREHQHKPLDPAVEAAAADPDDVDRRED